MKNEVKKLITDTRQWIEQERVWDNSIYATAEQKTAGNQSGGVPEQRDSGNGGERFPIKNNHSLPLRSPAVSVARPSGPPPSRLPASPLKAAALTALYEKYKTCTRCPLGFTRIKFVFGIGSPDSEVLFIGEGPGFYEDRKGEPFVGRSGQLLDKIMASIGLNRQNAYIANIVKCHPMINPQTPDAHSNDRPPTPEEVATCAPILLQQIAIIQPRVIVTLGSPSTRMILRTKEPITPLRGKLFPFAVDAYYPEETAKPGDLFLESPAESTVVKIDAATRAALYRTQVIPTFHPAAVLRNPNLKADVWTDMKLLRDTIAKK
jgi:uracil-DNA glycosylase family 4